VNGNRRAIDAVLQSGKPGEVYNIGGSCEKKNIDVVHAICSILDGKLMGNSSLITHNSSLYELIEFISFEEGLKQTVRWYLENQDWVENVVTGEYQEYYGKVYGND